MTSREAAILIHLSAANILNEATKLRKAGEAGELEPTSARRLRMFIEDLGFCLDAYDEPMARSLNPKQYAALRGPIKLAAE